MGTEQQMFAREAWTKEEFPRDEIEVTTIKQGSGIHLQYGLRSSSALDVANMPSRVQVELVKDWSITFGTSENPADAELTNRLIWITSQFEDQVGYRAPWQIRPEGYPWRIGEEGNVCAKAFPPDHGGSTPLCKRNPHVRGSYPNQGNPIDAQTWKRFRVATQNRSSISN
jgi:hypothetical protein